MIKIKKKIWIWKEPHGSEAEFRLRIRRKAQQGRERKELKKENQSGKLENKEILEMQR